MNKKKIVAIALLLGAVLLGWLFFYEAPRPQDEAAQPEEPPALSYIGNTLSEEKDGKKIWELTAEVIEMDPDTRNTLLKNIRGVFYQENGETVTMTAPHAVYDTKESRIDASDGVRAVSGDMILDADRIRFETAKERFIGEGRVRLTRGDIVLTGDKLEASDGFSRFKVTGNAHIVQGGKS